MSGVGEIDGYAAWINREGDPRLAWVHLEESGGRFPWRVVMAVPLIPGTLHAGVRRGVHADARWAQGDVDELLFDTIDEAIDAITRAVRDLSGELVTRGAAMITRGQRNQNRGDELRDVADAIDVRFREAAAGLAKLRQRRLATGEAGDGREVRS